MPSKLIAAAVLAASSLSTLRADEGMWLVNQPPLAALKDKYGFEPSPQWLEHMQKSAVRFQTGGSGSVVSADGLVMTNHHVGSDMLLKLSTAEHDLLKEGFYAPSRDQELKCPDLELNILWSIKDVTDQVNDAAAGLAPAEANTARRQTISALEAAAREETGLQPQVVTLYQGARYHLYLYKKFTDVRLVFAPEEAIAFFGGDTDNFEFPRYDLDCCFFRIYENGKPFHAQHHLDWSTDGADADDLVFVFGHPGRTRRAFTLDHLRFLRDLEIPVILSTTWRNEIKYQTFAGRSAENNRIVRDDLFGTANSRKAYTGIFAGLADPALMAAKAREEQQLRETYAKAGHSEETDPWQAIARAKAAHAEFFERARLLTPGWANGRLLNDGLSLVRLAAESAKPSEQRLPEFADARLESLRLELFSPAPLYESLETAKLESWMLLLVERLGGDDPTVKSILAGQSPRARAEQLVAACTFKTPQARKALAEAGPAALAASKDPLLKLLLALDPELRDLRKRYEDQVESVERESYAAIAAARFAARGDSVYPDATFTLRMTYGPVAGLPGATDGSQDPFTTLSGLYQRHAERAGEPGFELPQRWLKARDQLDLSTPFNFTAAVDIIGGNSGSPVVNRAGEVVGLIFDGNIHSLVGDLVYDGRLNRAVAVDSRGMLEAFRKVYNAAALVDELTAR